jgi:hypothetical protein
MILWARRQDRAAGVTTLIAATKTLFTALGIAAYLFRTESPAACSDSDLITRRLASTVTYAGRD